jgi:hypothetical protein
MTGRLVKTELLLDQVLEARCWLLGFDANNKKKIGHATQIAQDLSISNVVTISWRFHDIPL